MRHIDNAYDDFLSSHADEAVRTIAAYEEKLHGSLVKFGRFTIPTFFKPQFISSDQEKQLKRAAECIMSALDKVVNLYFTEPSLKRLFGKAFMARLKACPDGGVRTI